jgi:ribonucleoside-diphosphate reductase beta chain
MLEFDDSVSSSDDFSSSSSTYYDTVPRKKSKPTRKLSKVTKKEKIIFPVSSSLDPITIGAKRPSADQIKIVGGRGYDLRQPIPVKYAAVRERFLDARKNFWTPNDIPMGEDKRRTFLI